MKKLLLLLFFVPSLLAMEQSEISEYRKQKLALKERKVRALERIVRAKEYELISFHSKLPTVTMLPGGDIPIVTTLSMTLDKTLNDMMQECDPNKFKEVYDLQKKYFEKPKSNEFPEKDRIYALQILKNTILQKYVPDILAEDKSQSNETTSSQN